LFVVLLVTDTEFEFALFGPEDDGLSVHPSDHVEGCPGFAAQGQFQEIFLNASLDGLAQLGLDLEEAVGGTKSVNALIGPLVIVIFNPQLDPLAGGVEAVELGPHQELLPEGGPEAFHLAEGHGMLGPRFEVRDPVLLQFRLKPAGARQLVYCRPLSVSISPGGWNSPAATRYTSITAAAVGLRNKSAPHDEPRVIIQEGDDIGVTSAQPEGEDVRLPHLIGRGSFEEPGTRDIPLFRRRTFRHQLSFMQTLPHRLRAGRQKEAPAQHLADTLDAEGGILLFEFNDLLRDGSGQPIRSRTRRLRLQTGFTAQPIGLQPVVHAALANVELLGDQGHAEAFLEMQPHGPKLFSSRVTAHFFRAASPPRGAVPLLLCYNFLIHANTPFIIGVSTNYPSKSVSRSGR
jgi:hypothetical protein